MHYYSINQQSPVADFREATIKGQAPDKGLYFPESIPELPVSFFAEIESYSKEEIALRVIQPYIGNTIPKDKLEQIVRETVSFDFPLVPVDENSYSLELFHGPTLAFKDVGARFMSRCLGYFVQDSSQQVTVLVATSGDTGGAVANGFLGVDGINVVILYPSGKVSNIQELQLVTPGRNVKALEIEGSFDDCQQLVKQAFADRELNKTLFLTSANSINVARWLPQQFYYFYAWQQWKDKKQPPVISVPSGNFGNICAGILAKHSGLPVSHFIAACNANDTIPDYLNTGIYKSRKSVATISNAMDVAEPSNFIRILEILEKDFEQLKKELSSESISDDLTRKTVREVFDQKHYLLDPHGAVAYYVLKNYLAKHQQQKGIFLETAHPVKFYDVLEPIIHKPIEIPSSAKELLGKEKKSIKMKADYNQLKDFLQSLPK